MPGVKIKNRSYDVKYLDDVLGINLNGLADGLYQLVIKDKATNKTYNETVIKNK